MKDTQHEWQPAAWSAMLAATTIGGTVVIGCMMPFAAIAAIAALALPRRTGMVAVMVCWLGNQVIGFGLLGFPWDAATFGAGLSLLAASLLGWGVAGGVSRRLGAGGGALLVFVAAFLVYEAALLAYAAALGDLAMFAPPIIGLIAMNDALWFAGLWLGWQVLRLTAPATSARPAA